MLFSGCIWDLVAEIFANSSGTSADLLAAAKVTGKLLVEGSKVAPITSRFFQSVGRAMVLADETLHRGANHEHINAAFQRHAIRLGSNAMLAPTIALAGAAPTRSAPLHASTKKDIIQRLGADRTARVTAQPVDLFGQRVTRAVVHKQVDLSSVHKALAGVVAQVDVPVNVGASGARAAIVGLMPEPVATDQEVQTFARSLIENGQIELPSTKKSVSAVRGRAIAGKSNGNGTLASSRTTHTIATIKGTKVLKRVRFH